MKQLLLTVFLFIISLSAFSQVSTEQKKLEARRRELVKEMKEINGLIKVENSKEKTVTAKIYENDAKIKLSEKLISTTSRQNRILTDQIYLNQLKINKLNRELKVLKEDYAKTLLNAYKSRSDQSRIMFILSSENFLEAYKRIQYMKQYASFRKVQGEEIRDKMTELEKLQNTLEVQKKEKEKLLAESKKEKEVLETDRSEQKKLIAGIKKDKKKYAGQIKAIQKEDREIERKIDAIIKAAIAEANRKAAAKKAAEEGKSTAVAKTEAKEAAASNKLVLTKEGKIISDNFKANKGRLPWPVDKGYISSGFGTHASPFDSSVKIKNSGIDITTEAGAAVRAVFAGEVLNIRETDGKKAILIQHGEYLTMYLNLESVSVNVGDKVSAKERIGTVAKDLYGTPMLKFIVSQNSSVQNPSSWLAK